MTKNPFTRTYQLQQHTPIIHFQSEQKDATLRATELKPKLDKYILWEAYDNDFEKFKHLLVGFKGQTKEELNHLALDYKVNIQVENVKTYDIPDKYPCFFANMGEGKQKKFAMASGIKIEFFSKKKKILEQIEELFPDFLMYHNFGTRQSKGFGAFYIDKNDPKYYSGGLEYFFEVDVSRERSPERKWREVFSQIDLFYKSLRAGINVQDRYGPTFYFKSLAFKYANTFGSPTNVSNANQNQMIKIKNNPMKVRKRRYLNFD